MSAEEKNKILVRRYVQALHEGDLDALDELLAPDFVDHTPLPGQDPGREGYIQGVAEDHAALSNARTTFEYQTTDGDMVITRFTTRAVHDRGAYFGVGPTDQERETIGILIHRISGGKNSRGVERGQHGAVPGESCAGDKRARTHRAGAQRGEAHPASLAPQDRARTGGLADLSLLPTRQGGGRRLLRLPVPF